MGLPAGPGRRPRGAGEQPSTTSASTVHPDPRFSTSTSYDDSTPSAALARPVAGRRQPSRLPPGPDADETRLAYLADFDTPRSTVSAAPTRTVGLDLTWDAEDWPYLWYSMEAGGGGTASPGSRVGYFLALAPGAGWPAHGLHEVRRASVHHRRGSSPAPPEPRISPFPCTREIGDRQREVQAATYTRPAARAPCCCARSSQKDSSSRSGDGSPANCQAMVSARSAWTAGYSRAGPAACR